MNSKDIYHTVADFGNSFGNAIADGALSLGKLFDFTPSQTKEQQPAVQKKKPKKQKKRGRSR